MRSDSTGVLGEQSAPTFPRPVPLLTPGSLQQRDDVIGPSHVPRLGKETPAEPSPKEQISL